MANGVQHSFFELFCEEVENKNPTVSKVELLFLTSTSNYIMWLEEKLKEKNSK